MNKTWYARILLVIFLAGLALAIVSFAQKNNALGGTAVFFLVAGGIGTWILRRDIENQEKRGDGSSHDSNGEDDARQ